MQGLYVFIYIYRAHYRNYKISGVQFAVREFQHIFLLQNIIYCIVLCTRARTYALVSIFFSPQSKESLKK